VNFDFERARRATPARLGVGRAGPRPRTLTWLRFQHDHAAARDAVWSEWHPAFIEHLERLSFVVVSSTASSRAEYVRNPPLGRQLAAGEIDRIRRHSPPSVAIQLVLSDGLSAQAAEAHFTSVYPALRNHLERLGALGVPIAVRNGRVAVADPIAAAVGAQLVVHLIGERPGLGCTDSLGCYLTYQPSPTTTDADRKCVSNIRRAGLNPEEAGATIAGVCQQILACRSSGTDLEL
jgi:ethanolamine ammonia-lyase small subunit